MTVSFNYLTKTKAIWHTRSMATITETRQLSADILDEVLKTYKHRHDAKIYAKDHSELIGYFHELTSWPIKAERLNNILMRLFLIYIRNLKQLRPSEKEQLSYITNTFKKLGYQHVDNG